MESLSEVVTYPMEREDWLKTVLIGGVLAWFGFLLVPLFLVYGYVVRAIRASLEEDPRPPAFEEWGELFVDGFKAWVIGLVYMLVPLIVAGVTIGGSIATMGTGSEAAAARGVGSLIVGFALTLVLALTFGYLAVAAIVNFAREDRFGAAFDFEVIKTVALDRDYAVAWLVSVAVFLVAGFVNGVPFVGWLLAPFVGFYAAVVAANLWAGGFAQAMESSAMTGRATGEEPTV